MDSENFITFTSALLKNQLERIFYCHSIQAFDFPAGLADKSGIKVPDLEEEISAFQF